MKRFRVGLIAFLVIVAAVCFSVMIVNRLSLPHPAQAKLVDANNAFAIELYKQMAHQQDEKSVDSSEKGRAIRSSFCFSPYSIATLTQMLKLGARGETEHEIAETLGLSSFSEEDLYGAYGSLFTSLASDHNSRPFELLIANRIWLQKQNESQFLPQFKQLVKERCFFDVEEVDFNNTEKSSEQINDWMGKQTQGQMEDVTCPQDFSDLTQLVALNTVFFKGTWVKQFKVEKTYPETFYDSDGKTELGEVPMMRISEEDFQVGAVDGLLILRKLYEGDMSFVVLLPPEGEKELEKLEASLSVANLQKWLAATEEKLLDTLWLPKFEIKSEFPLIEVMKQLGVKEIFNPEGADFSGMVAADSPLNPLFVNVMRHKATIQVDEEGTVATAVTMVDEFTPYEPLEINDFIADRPFLFLIVDEKSSSILFMGRYMGPEGSSEGQGGSDGT